MGRIIAIANLKGGVGKSTVALNLAGAFAEQGKRILLIDVDQQAHLSATLLDDIYSLPHTITEVLLDLELPIEKAVYPTAFSQISIIPANLGLGKIDLQLADDGDAQYYLADKLSAIADAYDVILIDCPPSLGLATRSALVAAHGVIIPLECQAWAAKATTLLLELIGKIRRRANPHLKILGYLINKYSMRRRIEEDYRQMLYEQFGEHVFQTTIKDSAKYAEAVSLRKPITHYLPHSEQAEAFRALAKEVLRA